MSANYMGTKLHILLIMCIPQSAKMDIDPAIIIGTYILLIHALDFCTYVVMMKLFELSQEFGDQSTIISKLRDIGLLRRFIRSRGIHKGSRFLEYIREYLFRWKSSDVFDALMCTNRRKYPFDS